MDILATALPVGLGDVRMLDPALLTLEGDPEKLAQIVADGRTQATRFAEAAIADGCSPAAMTLIEADFSGQQREAAWRAEFRTDAALQAEFPSEDAYVALRRWEAGQK